MNSNKCARSEDVYLDAYSEVCLSQKILAKSVTSSFGTKGEFGTLKYSICGGFTIRAVLLRGSNERDCSTAVLTVDTYLSTDNSLTTSTAWRNTISPLPSFRAFHLTQR